MSKRSLLILCLVVGVNTGSFSQLAPVLPFLIAKLTGSMSAIAVTQVSALYAGAQLVMSPIIGQISDQVGRKRVMAVCISVGIVAFLGSAVAPTISLLMLFQAIAGGSASLFALAQAMVADGEQQAKERTISFGALGAALGLGFVFGPAVGGILGSIDPRAPFFLAALLSLINLILVIKLLPETLSPSIRATLQHTQRPQLRWWSAKNRDLQRMLGIYFLFYLGFSSFTGIFVVDISKRFGWGSEAAGLLLCFVGVVAAGVQGGLLPRLLRRYRAEKLAEIGMFLVAAALLAITSIPQGQYLYITQLVFAVGVGLSTPGLRTLLSLAVNNQQQGALGGLTQSCVSLTSLIGPLLAGQLYSRLGPQTTFGTQSLVVLSGAILLYTSQSVIRRLQRESEISH